MITRQDTFVPELTTRCGGIVEAFFQNLSPDEKELFKATTLAEHILEEVRLADKAHKEKSYGRKVSQALKPFLAGINQYGQALDVISNASSAVLSPLWGGVRIILHLASEYGEYFEKITTMLQQIGLNLNSLRRFPRLYPHNKQLEVAMVDVYQTIFDFCSEAREVFKKAGDKKKGLKVCLPVGLRTMSKLLWKPFKQQFGDIQETLQSCMDRVEREVDLAEKEEAHAERERAESDRRTGSFRWNKTEQTHQKIEDFLDDHNKSKVDQWLGLVNYDSNHKTAMKLRHSGTGRWFLQGQAFQTWLNNDNSFLWLHAIPGAGKTILISSAVEYLKENIQSQEVGLAYFYTDYKESQKKEPSQILCTLLSQLAKNNKHIFQRVQSFFQEQRKENPAYCPRLEEIRSNFNSFIAGTFKKVILVVDAIDECNSRKCITSSLRTIKEACPTVNILVSSREEHEISRAFKGLPRTRMKESDVIVDIESYVTFEVDSRMKEKTLKIRSHETKQIVCDTLVKKSEGMFQWVKCQIEVLSNLGTDKAIKKALEQLPTDLVGTYTRILERIENEHQSDIANVQNLLKWLVKGARSLTLEELCECVAIDLEEENVKWDVEAIMTDPEDILKLCSSLVIVSEDNQKVALAHYTVQEFLLSRETKRTLKTFYFGGDDVDVELTQICLTYLNYGDFVGGSIENEVQFTKTLEKYKFLEYAAQYWERHARQSLGNEDKLQELIMRLLHSSSKGRGNYKLWNQVYLYAKSGHKFTITSEIMPIFYAATFGLPRTLATLFDEGADIDYEADEVDPTEAAVSEGHQEVVQILFERYGEQDKAKLGRYLYTAAAKGHEPVARFLLKRGAPIDDRCGKQGTPLQVSVLGGNVDVVHTLLKQGASTKVVCPRFGTPLAAAAEKGVERTFQLLLDAGAAVNGKGGWYGFPLMSAIVGKNDVLVQILLNKGANVNLLGGRHVCALMAAAAIGKIELVEQLIDLGAKVNDENDKGADALHAACCAGRLDVVELLLSRGADVHAKGGKHRNALNAASAEGYPRIVQRLLKAGADPLVFDENYGNAFQAAVSHGHNEIAKILKDAGADVNATGGIQGSALVSAASMGYVTTIELLFTLGVPSGRTQDISDAMVVATHKQHEDVVNLLIQSGADINAAGLLKGDLWTPLQVAANKGHALMVAFLLDHGADVNVIGGIHGSALIAAADSDKCSCQVLELLISNGVRINEIIEASQRDSNPTKFTGHASPLAAAVSRNNKEAVKLLLEHGADPNLVNGNFCTALMSAVSIDSPTILDYLFAYGADVNITIAPCYTETAEGVVSALQRASCYGTENMVRILIAKDALMSVDHPKAKFKTALQAASFMGRAEVVKILLELGSDVNARGGLYGSCLQAAACRGYTEVMKILIDAGAEIDESDVGKYGSALIGAILNYKIDGVSLMLEAGANPSLKTRSVYQYPLQAAADLNYCDIVQMLCDFGADVNSRGGKFHTALQASAKHGFLTVMEILIGNGADVNLVGGMYGTALEAAYTGGWYLCIDLLYEHGASNHIQAGCYTTALGAAINGACQTLIVFLIKQHNADVNLSLLKRGSPLYYAIYCRQDEIDVMLDLFLANGADPNQTGGFYGTPLGLAAAYGLVDVMRKLLDHGADVNISGNRHGTTPLMIATIWRQQEARKLLLACNPDIHANGVYGTSLQLGSWRGDLDLVQNMLSQGAHVNASGQGWYGHCLQAAAIRVEETTARFLIAHGADVNMKGGRFGSVLQAACIGCSEKFIRFLIRKKADVNAQGGRYETALQAAAATGRVGVVQILLSHNADVRVQGGKYGSALQAACAYGNEYIVKMLVKHGADVHATGGFHGTALQAAAVNGWWGSARYLMKKLNISEATVDRRLNNKTSAAMDLADETLKTAVQKQEEPDDILEEEVLPAEETAKDEEIDDDQAEEALSAANNSLAAPSATDVQRNAASSSGPDSETPSDTGIASTNSSIEEEAHEGSPHSKIMVASESTRAADEGEDMSALSWLQVECGYGGDLSGPGR